METLQRLKEKCLKFLKEEPEILSESSSKEAESLGKEMLRKLKEIITDTMNSISKEDPFYIYYQGMLSAVLCQMGLFNLRVGKLTEAEENFKSCYDSIPDHLSPRFFLISLKARQNLGIICINKSQWNESRTWLEEAEKLYEDYTSQCKEEPKNLMNQFEEDGSNDGRKETELLYTKIKLNLAHIYTHFNDFIKSAINCHQTLKRELLYEDYDAVKWVVNASTLSQFFLKMLLFKQARHHLAAASYILDNYEEKVKNMTGTKEEIDEKLEEVQHRSADNSRCWAQYGISLLSASKDRLNNPNEEPVKEKNEKLENLWFDNLNLSAYENEIVDTTVLFFEDARDVFLTAQKHLRKAKEYYTLEDKASDHVHIIQSHSLLFKLLLAFEKDEERQYKMNKKRVELLESVSTKLNPKYYLGLCRELWFELGETYYLLLSFHHENLNKSNKVPTPKLLQKINNIVESGIKSFKDFLDSVKDEKTGKVPEVPPDDVIESTITAHFYLGQLFLKYITYDKVKKNQNIDQSSECFKYVVNCCEKSEKAREVAGEQLKISQEMITLLRLKKLRL